MVFLTCATTGEIQQSDLFEYKISKAFETSLRINPNNTAVRQAIEMTRQKLR